MILEEKINFSIKDDDDSHNLAESFCAKHRLCSKVALIKQIKQNLVYQTTEDNLSTYFQLNFFMCHMQNKAILNKY